MLGVSLAHLLDNTAEFFTLSLRSASCSEPPLKELECALILRHTQQLHGAPFKRSLATHFADNVANELVAASNPALALSWTLWRSDLRDSVALVWTNRHLVDYLLSLLLAITARLLFGGSAAVFALLFGHQPHINS